MKIAIIDYNAGNIASVANALERLGYEYVITRDAKTILAADKVIFPGQGRAAPAMKDLRESGLDEVIKQITKPFLGVCLGMQLLFQASEEDDTECLGIIEGTVKKFAGDNLKIPQIGWNTITSTAADPIFEDTPDTMYAYFVNSYYAERDRRYTISASTYGDTALSSIVRKNNFYGTQFHPEKSGPLGLQLLKNFCELDEPKQNNMLVLPAIDLIDGKCVRLNQGDYAQQTTYNENPLSVASSFIKDGVRYVHVVDLDGAKKGTPMNTDVILRLIASSSVPVQVGGGIRSIEDAKRYLDAGAGRTIISTSALSDPALVQTLLAEYGPERIVVSIDSKNGFVATRGWQTTSTVTVDTMLKKLAGYGITTIIYTDITRDGTLKGPDFESIERILKTHFKVIIAGGISDIADLKKLNELGAYGAITGKAVYEGKLNLKQVAKEIPSPHVQKNVIKPAHNVTKRVIACMDIANGRVVKGVNFKDVKDAGDAVELGKKYSDSGVDELVFLDINATVENRKTLYALVTRISKNINIPFSVGGGVKTIEDIKRLLEAGADKVSIGSAAITDPDFVSKAAQEFGSQCIVISVDPKRKNDGTWEVYIQGGREATGVDAIEFCKDMARRGAGELLVNSLDRDGTKKGYDLDLLKAVSESVPIPVIASSGAGTKEHFLDAITKGKADAVLAASLFHSGEIAIPELKDYLRSNGISIRL